MSHYSERIQKRIDILIQEFGALASWEDKYKLLIEKGKRMAALPEAEKSSDLLVKGCQSQVWLKAKVTAEGDVEFQADSDALIVKGLVALLLEVYSLASTDEILSTSPEFLESLGLKDHLSPSRANGLYAMVRQIHFYAIAFKAYLSEA